MKPAQCWCPAWRVVAHVVLVLSLVFNLRVNINLNQPKEGTHMAKTIKQSVLSKKYKARRKSNRHVAKPTATTNCVGAGARRSA